MSDPGRFDCESAVVLVTQRPDRLGRSNAEAWPVLHQHGLYHLRCIVLEHAHAGLYSTRCGDINCRVDIDCGETADSLSMKWVKHEQ